MKKIILIAIVLALLYGGYRYGQAVINFEKLSSRIDIIISQPQAYSVAPIKEFIVSEAGKLGIPLMEKDVEVAISDTGKASLGERLIERPEIEVESKLLTIRFSYPVRIYGISRVFTYDVEKVFTSGASLVLPDIEVDDR